MHQAHGQATAPDPGEHYRRELAGEHAARGSTRAGQGGDFDRLQIDTGRIRTVRSDDVGGAIAGGDLQRLHTRVHAHGQRGRLSQHGDEPQGPRRGQPGSRLRRALLDRPCQGGSHRRCFATPLDQHGIHGRCRRGRADRACCRSAGHHAEDSPRQVDAEREHHAQPLLRVVGGRLRLVGQGADVATELGRAFPVRMQCLAQLVCQLARRILLRKYGFDIPRMSVQLVTAGPELGGHPAHGGDVGAREFAAEHHHLDRAPHHVGQTFEGVPQLDDGAEQRTVHRHHLHRSRCRGDQYRMQQSRLYARLGAVLDHLRERESERLAHVEFTGG
ncbi:hypothetical protein [Nocardia sp. SC052]|uniref:hypothetical protein n=1 Tax=Nocardia sichangensis TaxID=3385975 RepID=UPI00399F4B85